MTTPPQAKPTAPTTTSWVSDPSDPNNVKIENGIRHQVKLRGVNKPTGELSKAYLEKVTVLHLDGNQLPNVKGLEKLTQLTELSLNYNPDLTKAQITRLQKVLRGRIIGSNPKKQSPNASQQPHLRPPRHRYASGKSP